MDSLRHSRFWFRWLVAGWVTMMTAVVVFAAEASRPEGRLTGTFEGIECEYTPGREELARLLAHRFVLYNEAIAETRAATKAAEKGRDLATVPLSPAEMRAKRATYLKQISALLGLAKPTSLQEECYGAFVDNYDQTMQLIALAYSAAATLTTVKRVTIWDRTELAGRLEKGEQIAGFSFDPKTNSGRVTYGVDFEGRDERLKELGEQRKKLRLAYNLELKPEDGGTTYNASVRPKSKTEAPRVSLPKADANSSAKAKTDWFPVVVPVDLKDLPPDQLAVKLWDGNGDRSVVKFLVNLAGIAKSVPEVDRSIAFLVLHETIELGIVDRYFRGPDRRWFCDGVANYGAWRAIRDVHGEKLATQAHDLRANLVRYADLRDQADLRKWPATENQPEDDKESRLNSARYTFAEQAVYLMNADAGEDVLPKLFKEIGRTKAPKVSMDTVEKAWATVSKTPLDTILAKAIQPLPAPAAATN